MGQKGYSANTPRVYRNHLSIVPQNISEFNSCCSIDKVVRMKTDALHESSMDLFALYHRTIISVKDGYNFETLLSDKGNVSAHFRAGSFMK